MLVLTFLLLAFCVGTDSYQIPEEIGNGSRCTLAPLEDHLNRQCPGGYAYRCTNANLTEIPADPPTYNSSSKLCLLDFSRNKLTHIYNNSFTHAKDTMWLYLFENNISIIDANAFTPVKNIRLLDISYNEHLRFNGMKAVLTGLKNSPIRHLVFNRIHERFESGTNLAKKDIEPIKYLKKLSALYLDLNKIETICEEAYDLFPTSLNILTLAGNRLTYGKYVEKLHDLRHIQFLDLSRQHLTYDPFQDQHYNYTPPEDWENVNQALDLTAAEKTVNLGHTDLTFPVSVDATCINTCMKDQVCIFPPPRLVTLKWRKSFLNFKLGSLKVCGPSSLKKLELSFNLITEWIGPVIGLEKLTKLDLAENYCQNISSFFFDTLYSLKTLNLSYNFLGPVLANSRTDAGKHFQNLTQLEELDLSENKLTSLAKDAFQNLRVLKNLNVSGNMLTHWNSTLNTNCLRLLDLSGNRLESLPEWLRNNLDDLAKLDREQSCNRTEQVTVVLTNNPIGSGCDSRPFLKWLAKTAVNISFSDADQCLSKDGVKLRLHNKADIVKFVNHLDSICFPYVSVILSVCIFFISVTVCGLVYRYRWKLRHLYYSKRQRHHYEGYDRLFECDAFISYSKSQGSFIKNSLVPQLEGERFNLKVWVADRDSHAGSSVAENITHAINNCKKSVLLLSKSYFSETWCNYEMNMARIESVESRRKLMILVLLEDMSARDIPLDYLRLLKSEQSIEYPSHPQDLDTFWASLKQAIKKE